MALEPEMMKKPLEIPAEPQFVLPPKKLKVPFEKLPQPEQVNHTITTVCQDFIKPPPSK